MPGREAWRAAEAVARESYGKLVAYLAARWHDVAAAEDALADAFAAALATWPVQGVPAAPAAWLLTVARRKRVDAHRQQRSQEALAEALQGFAGAGLGPDGDDEPVHDLPDERLALMFACAHPAIDVPMRAPLMLQTILGLDAAAIGSAFLVAPATMGQRLVRAKTRIRHAGIPFRVPPRDELPDRLVPVLEAVYAAFAEAWVDAAGADARRRNLAEEAVWLGRVLASLLPDSAEALGLLALMLHSQARQAARRDAQGRYVPLTGQDTARWDGALIDEAEMLLHRAGKLNQPGRYQLEAAVQSVHAARRHTGRTDWAAIERLYAGLMARTGSPVVALNHAVALAEVAGVAAGLVALAACAGDPRLARYQPYWAARAALLHRAGRRDEADAAYQQAIGLASDAAVREHLSAERRRCADGG